MPRSRFPVPGVHLVKERRQLLGQLLQEGGAIKALGVGADIAIGGRQRPLRFVHEGKVPGVRHASNVRTRQLAGAPVGVKFRHQEAVEFSDIDPHRQLDGGQLIGGQRHADRRHRDHGPNAAIRDVDAKAGRRRRRPTHAAEDRVGGCIGLAMRGDASQVGPRAGQRQHGVAAG